MKSHNKKGTRRSYRYLHFGNNFHQSHFFLSLALTPAEVLKLKEAGVIEETIQTMLQNEAESRISSDQVEQACATDHLGSWRLKNGRTIHSTGKRQRPLD
jgi:hypothetical protein